jgi:hypothetical protein
MAVPPQSVARYCGERDPQGGNALRPRVNIFTTFHSRLYFVRHGTQRRCAMGRMSKVETLIFIAAVVVMVTLAVWVGL